jgi:predicted ArsR family transcriptional regulator
MVPDARELHSDVVRFIDERIDTVPHLEALLLLWDSAPMRWTADQVAARLYVSSEAAASILDALVQRQLAESEGEKGRLSYHYDGAWDVDGTRMTLVAATYRRQLVQVSSLIHSKASTAVRDFARAFRLKKE